MEDLARKFGDDASQKTLPQHWWRTSTDGGRRRKPEVQVTETRQSAPATNNGKADSYADRDESVNSACAASWRDSCGKENIVKNLILAFLFLPSLLVAQTRSVFPKSLTLTHVTVIDATGSPAKLDMTVQIRDPQNHRSRSNRRPVS
jgi:hypothetical protein